MGDDKIVVKQIVIDIACYESVDAAELVNIALASTPEFWKYDYDHGGCYVVGVPSCEASWSAAEYESSTGIDVMDVD